MLVFLFKCYNYSKTDATIFDIKNEKKLNFCQYCEYLNEVAPSRGGYLIMICQSPKKETPFAVVAYYKRAADTLHPKQLGKPKADS